jgi:GGDEF domain-containing protein
MSGLRRGLRHITYAQARRLLLAAGLGVLALVAAVMYVRRIETVEVAATLFFIPIFIAAVFWRVPGGVVAGALAAGGYAALRFPAIDAVGAGRFTNLLISRSIAFLVFGAIGGWANGQLETSLEKLELYDQIDDETGLYNARFFVQDTDLEMSRAQRYQTLFSVALVDFPGTALASLSRRQRFRALRDLGRLLRASIRTVDRAVHADDGTRHRLAVVLPETGPEGAKIFLGRLVERIAEYLDKLADVHRFDVGRTAVTFPGDDEVLKQLREQFAAIDRTEHPEPAGPGGERRGAGGPGPVR